MKKKVIGIFICTLFLFSSLPTITGTNINKNIEKSLLMTKDSNNIISGFSFIIFYGRIVYHGEVVNNNQTYYNITAIFLRLREIAWVPGHEFASVFSIIADERLMFPKDWMDQGFIGNNYMVLWEFGSLQPYGYI